MRRSHIVAAEKRANARWLTAADVAKELQIHRNGVHFLRRGGALVGEQTRSGQWIFHVTHVRDLGARRADRRSAGRLARLRDLHLRMVRADLEPRQMQLDFVWGRGARGERSLCDRTAKPFRLLRKSA